MPMSSLRVSHFRETGFPEPDNEEEILAGELYYAAPGHTMFAKAGTVLVEFSPKDQFRELTEIAEENSSKMIGKTD